MARDICGATARGVVGAMAMTGVRTLAGSLGVVRETPPQAIAEEATAGMLAAVPKQYREAAVELAHWAVGAAGGAIFGLLPAVWRRPATGVVYGLGIWWGFEAMLAPALGLDRHEEQRAAERLVLAADHVLYGLILSGAPAAPRPAASTAGG